MLYFKNNRRFGRSLLLAALVASSSAIASQLSRANARPVRRSPMPVRRWTSSRWASPTQ